MQLQMAMEEKVATCAQVEIEKQHAYRGYLGSREGSCNFCEPGLAQLIFGLVFCFIQ